MTFFLQRGQVLCLVSAILMMTCTYRIPAEDISQLQAGKTFNRQGNFLIGPGDEIDVFVFGEERLTGRFTVSPTGLLSFPLTAPMVVSGMTTAQLTRRLEIALQGLVKNPKISVNVLGVRSFQVYFAGEVARVGVVQLTSETSFLQALTLAGGLSEFATGRLVLIRQLGHNKVKRFAFRYEDVLTGERLLDTITLEAGDVIYAE
jgi:polysaccharide export outer membrane protein